MLTLNGTSKKMLSGSIGERGTSLIVFFVLAALLETNAQFNSNNIWGNTSNTFSIGEPLYNTRTWGRPPSEQTLNAMRNHLGNNPVNSNQRRRFRDGSGNIVLTDAQGNIIYGPRGNTIIDSLANSYGAAAGSMNADADGGPPPPPDDPIDTPIDGGVGILLAIGLAHGYAQFGGRKKKPIGVDGTFMEST